MTVCCRDCDSIPKAKNAGSVFMEGPNGVQLMHNGVRVLAGGYHGDSMKQIIHDLKGHHEPQEEQSPSPFQTETAGILDTPQGCLPAILRDLNIEALDILHCDAQGAEAAVIRSCEAFFAAATSSSVSSRRIRTISPTTH